LRALVALGCFVAVGLLACGRAATTPSLLPTPLPPQSDCGAAGVTGSLCILVLGDSIADGTPLNGDDRWWVKLGKLLEPDLAGQRIEVDSWAVPGSRVDVLESAARDQVALKSYDIAIVIEGVNDEIVSSIADWRPRYEAAIAAIEKQGVTVVVGTPPPNFENGTFATRYDPTAEALRQVAAAGHRPLLDIAARWHADGAAQAATYYSDLIHQGPAGQALMAQMAHDVVLDTVERMRPAG
jgi:lysophospholipase L1-like esterase